ncbi:MAG: DUF952 domain-containing protein [Planctomycetota bacterium]|nr:DUF952 domain-containing protein [Planctomycetota bacterium]
MNQELVYHIASREDWIEAQKTGCYSAPSLQSEGFIHFSTLEQCAATANLYYSSEKSLLFLSISVQKLSPELRWEKSRDDAHFPHLYGPLNIDAVLKAQEWRVGGDGVFETPSSANLSAKSVDK